MQNEKVIDVNSNEAMAIFPIADMLKIFSTETWIAENPYLS